MGKSMPQKCKQTKKEGVVILISHKLELSTLSIKEDNKWQDIMQKTMDIEQLWILMYQFHFNYFIKQIL